MNRIGAESNGGIHFEISLLLPVHPGSPWVLSGTFYTENYLNSNILGMDCYILMRFSLLYFVVSVKQYIYQFWLISGFRGIKAAGILSALTFDRIKIFKIWSTLWDALIYTEFHRNPKQKYLGKKF